MQDLFDKYNKEYQKFKSEAQKITDKQEKLVERIKRDQRQLAILRAREEALSPPSKYELIEVLAKRLARRFGLKYEIYGPFGLNCETSIYLIKDESKRITEQDTWSITLRLWDHLDALLTYDTGERTQDFPEGSIAAMNGGNSVFAPLPSSFEDIVALMKYEKRDEMNGEVL